MSVLTVRQVQEQKVKAKGWRARIAEAIVRGKFLREDVNMAASFTACAVGERSIRSGVSYGHIEECHQAHQLGMAFYLLVRHTNPHPTDTPLTDSDFTARDLPKGTAKLSRAAVVREAERIYDEIWALSWNVRS